MKAIKIIVTVVGIVLPWCIGLLWVDVPEKQDGLFVLLAVAPLFVRSWVVDGWNGRKREEEAQRDMSVYYSAWAVGMTLLSAIVSFGDKTTPVVSLVRFSSLLWALALVGRILEWVFYYKRKV